MTSVLSRSSALTARTKPTTGDTKTSFVNVDHLGWLNCNGRALDKVQYNLLFQVIGYTFGGSGNTFNLPNFQGRVQGSVGTIVEPCGTFVFPPGDSQGEVKHKLTITEMPAHNHDNATGSAGANTTDPGYTSYELTGITETQTGYAAVSDSGHTHGYTAPSGSEGTSSYNGAGHIDVVGGTSGATTSSGNANVSDAGHTHSITDPTHRHQIASNGDDECHNNMQPTLTYGNTFIYCGQGMNGYFPYHIGLSPVLI